MDKEDLNSRYRREELEDLRKVFERLDQKKQGRVDEDDLKAVLESLGHKPRKATETKDMIWEVDENGDQSVDWEEFQLAFDRCRRDRTGNEPRKLFNLIEFMMYDRDGSGSVSQEEFLLMMFNRYGRILSEDEIKKSIIFETDENGDGEMSFGEYLKMVNNIEFPKMAQRHNKGMRGSASPVPQKRSPAPKKRSLKKGASAF